MKVTPILVADLLAEGERMPVYVHLIDHPAATVLVDTGIKELHPAAADLEPRLTALDLDPADVDIVVNTHLHFDHCGGNHRFAGKPFYVQGLELDDALNLDDYTLREWVEAPGVEYTRVEGAFELLPGLRLVPAPGTRAARRWSSSRRAGDRSSSVGTSRSGTANWMSRSPSASWRCVRSTPSWSG